MNEIKINGFNNNFDLNKPEGKVQEGSFDSVMKESLRKVMDIQEEADKAIKDITVGGDITSAIIAMEKADMSFQLMVEVRNKLVGAYEEIMRMQV